MLTIGRRRNANLSLEPIRKVALRGESRRKRHVYHRHFGIAQKAVKVVAAGFGRGIDNRSVAAELRTVSVYQGFEFANRFYTHRRPQADGSRSVTPSHGPRDSLFYS